MHPTKSGREAAANRSEAIQSDAAALQNSLTKLLGAANACAQAGSEGEASSALLDQLVRLSGALARQRSATLPEVVSKIQLWRVLACEDALNSERALPDELLLLSIIEDVEHLAT